MRIFKAFLREKRGFFIYSIGISFIYLLILSLENADLNQLIYPNILLITMLFFVSLFMFFSFKKRYESIVKLMQNGGANIDEMPPANSLLDELYNELLLETLNTQHRKQQQLKDEINDIRNRVGLWAHQIKTPLCALKLSQKNEQAKLFEINEYVNTLLRLIRLKSDSNDFVFEKINLLNQLRADVKYFAPMFIAKGLYANIDIDENIYIASDTKWLSFIIRQILSNAVKYTNKGGVDIRYEKGLLYIKDSGIGILKEDIKRVFELSYTGKNGRIEKSASGLGLYLSKKAADMLDIGLEIDSVVGEGTQIALNLQNCKVKCKPV